MTVDAVTAFLAAHHGEPVDSVEALDGGAWSDAFGFRLAGRPLVVRFGEHEADFRNDERAVQYRSPVVPVPEVLHVGQTGDDWFAISERLAGSFLEDATRAEWSTLLPSLVAMLDALRGADTTNSEGFGGWVKDGEGSYDSWSEFLTVLGDDIEDPRGQGRQQALRDSLLGDDSFEEGRRVIRELVGDPVPRSVIHGDLLYRNAMFEGGRMTGLFDWGCAAYGDPLYDVAWFEFWAPWHPGIDPEPLVGHARRALSTEGVSTAAFDRRFRACLIAIGRDHLTYNASIGNVDQLHATDKRLAEFL